MTERVALWPIVLLSLVLTACGGAEQPPPETGGETAAEATGGPQEAGEQEESSAGAPSLSELAEGYHRAEGHVARNQYRNPVETLQFFGLEPDMHVVEIWPGAGWYTEIIAPYVDGQGKYYAAHWDPESEREYFREGVRKFREKLESRPDLYGNAEVTVLMPPEHWYMGPEGEADMVLTFRNVHNWTSQGYAQEMFDAAYTALKPGGVLGVVEHRADPDAEWNPEDRSGYVPEDYAIQLAESAGFLLVDSSDVNANPADTKDHPEGVWTLPPSLRLGEEDREKYQAIGESDRFTLKFRKPYDESAAQG